MIGIALAASTTLFKDNPIRIVILTSKVGFFFIPLLSPLASLPRCGRGELGGEEGTVI